MLGLSRVERFVLWSGVVQGDGLQVRTMHVPRQTAYRLSDGLCVRVTVMSCTGSMCGSSSTVNGWQYRSTRILPKPFIQIRMIPIPS